MPLLLLLVKATLLLCAALVVTLLMRRAPAGSRHQVWLVALAALLLLPALAAWGPLQLRVLPGGLAALPSASISNGVTRLADPATSSALIVNPAVSPSTAGPHSAPSPNAVSGHVPIIDLALRNVPMTLLALWGVVTMLLLGWLAYGMFTVRRIVGRAVPLASDAWQGPLYEIADRLGLDAAPRLLRSEAVKMPFACGLFDCIIVLPAESDGWSAERRSAVLVHELGHVSRRDLFGHTLGRITCALYWFHPLVWSAARRLRAESERACDDLALAFGARPSDYAEHLLDIVTCVRDHATPSVALALAHRKEFEGRMLAILNPELRRRVLGRWQTMSLVGSLAAVALVISAAAPVARTAAPVNHAAASGVHVAAPVADSAASVIAPGHDARGTARHNATEDAPIEEPATLQRIVAGVVPRMAKALLSIGLADSAVPTPERGALFARMLSTDSSPDVRRVAAWALRDYDSLPAATAALKAALANDADDRVREMSAWVLAERDDESGMTALAAAVRTDKADQVREMAVWGLGEHGDRTAAQDIVAHAAATDRSAQVRGTAAWALGSMDLQRVPAPLLVALVDSVTDVRMKAAWAVSEIGDSAALPSVRAALRRETDPQVQRAQLRALIHCDEDPSRMVEWLKSKDAQVRQMALKVLAGEAAIDPWPWPWPRPIVNP